MLAKNRVITVRLSASEAATLDVLMAVTEEKTASGALMRAALRLPLLIHDVEMLREELRRAQEAYTVLFEEVEDTADAMRRLLVTLDQGHLQL